MTSTSWFKRPTLARRKLMAMAVGHSTEVDSFNEAKLLAMTALRDRMRVTIRKNGHGWTVTRVK